MEEKIFCYSQQSSQYPRRLHQQTGMPEKLYVKGELPDEKTPTVAIVGARMCSEYGRHHAFTYAKLLAQQGVQIISGMALGIDALAHEGALAGAGKTFAVLGCGVDICYPARNRKIYNQIIEQGGVISEFTTGSPPLRYNFPMRNRIISGLADVVLIIEAKAKSGSLITADSALEQGKTVLALPGRVNDELSKGCNWLISQGAGVAYSVETVLNELNMSYTLKQESQQNQQKNDLGLASTKKLVYSCVDLTPKDLHSIIEDVSGTVAEISKILLELQLEGLVFEPFKNYYVRAET
jgi:DNA protecting protein DprA